MTRFERIGSTHAAEAWGRAVDLLPPVLVDRVQGIPPLFDATRCAEDFAGVWDTDRWGAPEHAAARYYPEGPTFRGDRRHRAESGMVALVAHTRRGDVGNLLHEYGHFVWDRLVRSNTRLRLYTPADQPGRVKHAYNSGLVPSMLPFTRYEQRNIGEQFAEAFRIWLSPWWALEWPWEPGQFYKADPRFALDDWGERFDNQRLLRWLNELAGWPLDQPPLAMRESC